MTPRSSPALLQALALFRDPRGARPEPQERLPEGIELLLRVVAGEAQALTFAMQVTCETGAAVRDAAVFYIQQVMFAPDSHSYRVLGVDPDASDEQLKSHYRLLTRWLHPDRNRDEWEAIYSERVNRAWHDLRNTERRQRYDHTRSEIPVAGPVNPHRERAIIGRTAHLDGAESALDLRWVPRAIFGALGLCVLVTVALFYLSRLPGSPEAPVAAAVESDLGFESRAPAPAETVHRDVLDLAQGKSAVREEPALAVSPPRAPPAPAPKAVAPPNKPLWPDDAAKQTPRNSMAEPVSSRVAFRQESPVATSPVEPAHETKMDVLPGAPERLPNRPSVAPKEAPSSAPISQREAGRVLDRFAEVYAEGDLAGLRAMFTADASSPDGGLDAILGDYDRLFERSRQRQLVVRNVSWSSSGDTFTILAQYETSVKTGRFGRSRSHGNMRLVMRQVDGQWRIYQLDHHERSD